MLVPDRQSPDIELSAAEVFASQVTLDRRHFLAGKHHAAELREIALCAFEEGNRVDVGLDLQGAGFGM